jgi:hypothetical protein
MSRTRMLRMICLSVVISFMFSISGCKGGKEEMSGLRLWIESPVVKVMRDVRPPDNIDAQKMILRSAKNEKEFGQVVLHPGNEDIEDIEFLPSTLVSESGAEISLDNIALYEVRYIYLPKYEAEYPDPLVPSTKTRLTKKQAQPMWYEVKIPKDAHPGMYYGKVDVYAMGELATSFDVELTVWDFLVPEKPSMGTSFGLTYEFIDHWHKVSKDSEKAKDLHDTYYWYMIDHRMTPRVPPVKFGSESYDNYVSEPRVTSLLVPYDWRIEQYVEILREKDWLDKAYIYAVDEPKTEGNYSWLRSIAEVIHEIEPSLRFVVPYYCSPEFAPNESAVPHMVGYVNLWCPVSTLISDSQEREKLRERQLMGETLWWYVCVGPQSPYANLHISMEGIDHRILFWQQAFYDIEGFLYWESIYWPFKGDPYQGAMDRTIIENPWTDMATVQHMNPNVYGDGALLYPGLDVGVDGPIPSIRFKLAYKGMVDFEYFTMYEELRGIEETKNQIKRMVRSLTNYSKSPVLMDNIRTEIGNELSIQADV